MRVSALVIAIILVAISFQIGKGYLRSGQADIERPAPDGYDYIIVGAGATGAVLARRLAGELGNLPPDGDFHKKQQ